VWHALSDVPKYKKRLIFGDLNCASERATCQQLSPGRAFPRLIWIDRSGAPIERYSGERDTASLMQFIRSQFGPSIHVIKSPADFEGLLSQRDTKPLFLFNVSKGDAASLKLVGSLTFSMRHFAVNFALIVDASDHEAVVKHLTSDGRTIAMDEELSVEALTGFVRKYSVPFFAPFSDRVAQFAELEQMAICVFLFPLDNTTVRDRALVAARSVSKHLPTAHSTCEHNPELCRYCGVGDDGEGVVIIINKSRNLFWVAGLDGNVRRWVESVLGGEVRGGGPGNGVLQHFWIFWYEMRAKGGIAYYLLFLPVVIFAFLVITALCIFAQPGQRKAHKD
jgi:hypothetical protein